MTQTTLPSSVFLALLNKVNEAVILNDGNKVTHRKDMAQLAYAVDNLVEWVTPQIRRLAEWSDDGQLLPLLRATLRASGAAQDWKVAPVKMQHLSRELHRLSRQMVDVLMADIDNVMEVLDK